MRLYVFPSPLNLQVCGFNNFWNFMLMGCHDCMQTFAKNDLPKQHRIVKDGDMMTQDHNPDR
jgi:hypothetical protein